MSGLPLWIPGPIAMLTDTEKYRLLREISYRIKDTLDLRTLLDHLLDAVQQIVPYDAAGIFVLNRDIYGTMCHRDLRVIASISQRGFDRHPDELDPMLMEGRGIIGSVITTGISAVIPDVHSDPRYVAGRTATLSEIAVPIIRDGQPFGALNLESDRKGAFDQDDVEVLQCVADAAAISIEKAILHAEILEKKRIDDQLQIAAEVQARLLPDRAPDVAGYSIAGLCTPAYEVGGDYFEYIPLDPGRLGIVVADVSGNGIAAALLMTAFRALLIPGAREGVPPASLMERMNAWLPEFARKRDFVTALYGILETSTGAFTYANCGQNLPFLVRADGSVERLTQSGPSLIIIPEARYEMATVRMLPGDLLILYTDGVIEVFDKDHEEFGCERLEKVAMQASAGPAPEVLQAIVEATRAFSGPERSHDDFTLVVVKRQSR